MNIKKIIKWSIFILFIIYAAWKFLATGNKPSEKLQNINFSNEKEKVASAKKKVQSETYTCPLHYEIIVDEPGICPKCGKTLVPKAD
ncbi:MAG TPA: heavy metal-binding domain-containing protein [bacterium]|nr:heavy metal-binding domain-containing protein [bacterium]